MLVVKIGATEWTPCSKLCTIVTFYLTAWKVLHYSNRFVYWE